MNCGHIDRLFEIHTRVTADESGGFWRHADSLHNSASVLLAAFWGAFCQELAADALDRLIAYADTADELPAEMRRLAARGSLPQGGTSAGRSPAGRDWRAVLSSRADRIRHDGGTGLLTRGTAQVNGLFDAAIGNDTISRSWHWPGTESAQAAARLDRFVQLGAQIAYQNPRSGSVTSRQVESDYEHVRRLVQHTEAAVEQRLVEISGKQLLL